MTDTTKHSGPRHSLWVPAPNQDDPNGEPEYVRSEAAFHSSSAAALATSMSLALGVETGMKDEGRGECARLFINAMKDDQNHLDLVAAVSGRMRKCHKERETQDCATSDPETCMKLCPHREALILSWTIHRHGLEAKAKGTDAQQTEEDSNMLEVAMEEILKRSMPAKGQE